MLSCSQIFFEIGFLPPLLANFAGGMLIGTPIIDKGLETVGYHQGPETIDIEIPQQVNPNTSFAGPINAIEQYSQYTKEHPVMGYGVIPLTAAGTLLGTGAVGKYMFGKKIQPNIKTGGIQK